jgi:phosphotransferase system HPr (HPr) family protein
VAGLAAKLKTKKGAPQLLKKRLHIRSRQGLHARPAALFVRVANRFKATIRVRKGRQEVDGKSIMGLLTLAASRGSMIQVTAKGADAPEAIHALEQLICKTEPPAVITILRHSPSHGAPPHPA